MTVLMLLLALLVPSQLPARTFDVRAFGAQPDDQAADDNAINAAVSACKAAGGGVVYLPRGRYNLSAPVVVADCQGVTLRGDGPATVLQAGGYCGPMVAIGLGGGSFPAAMRPPSPLTASSPRRSAATLGKAALAVTGHPLQFGWTSPAGEPDSWGGGGGVTLDVALSRPPGADWPQWTNLLGFCAPPDAPAPWVVRWADGGLVWDLAGEDGARRRLRVPVDPGAGLWRVSVQADFGADRAAAWVEGRLVASAWDPAWTVGPGPFRLRRHDGVTPFSVGYPAPRMDGHAGGGPGGIADLVLHGLKVSRAQVWQWDGPNPGQQCFAFNPAMPVTDDTRYFAGDGQVSPPGSLVALLPMGPEPPGSAWVSATSHRGRGLLAWLPPLTEVAVGTNRVAVEDLTIANPVQPGVLLGRHSAVALRRLVIAGGSQAVGSMPLMVGYPLTLDDCDLSGWDAPVVSFWQMVAARNLILSGVGRHGVRTVGGDSVWDGVKVWRLSPYTESVFRFVGGDDGLGQELRNVLVDNEDFAPSVAVVDCEQGPVQPGSLVVRGLKVNTPGDAPVLRLAGHGLAGGFAPYFVSASGLASFGGAAVGLAVEGPPAWRGDVDLRQLAGAGVAGDPASLAGVAVRSAAAAQAP